MCWSLESKLLQGCREDDETQSFHPSYQQAKQDLDFPVKSIAWPAVLPQLHRGKPMCEVTPSSNPNSQAKYSPTNWEPLLP